MLSSRARYATRALLDLAMHSDGNPRQIHEIAECQNIPEKFLEQILLQLKRGGWVASRKGPGGGYRLAVPAKEVSLGAVIRHLDGPLAPMSCVSASGYMECGCPDPEHCGLRTVWKEARDALVAVLDQVTFEEIVQRQQRLEGLAPLIAEYFI